MITNKGKKYFSKLICARHCNYSTDINLTFMVNVTCGNIRTIINNDNIMLKACTYIWHFWKLSKKLVICRIKQALPVEQLYISIARLSNSYYYETNQNLDFVGYLGQRIEARKVWQNGLLLSAPFSLGKSIYFKLPLLDHMSSCGVIECSRDRNYSFLKRLVTSHVSFYAS